MSTAEVEQEELPPLPYERQWEFSWMAPFLRALSLIPDVSSACRVARIGRTRAYGVRTENPEFALAWDESRQLAVDYIDRHIHRWVTEGVPVRSVRTVTKRRTDATGNVIETTTETVETESSERSATLMIFYAKAFNAERYRWTEKAEITGRDGGPIQLESLSTIDRQIEQLSAELATRAGSEPVPVE